MSHFLECYDTGARQYRLEISLPSFVLFRAAEEAQCGLTTCQRDITERGAGAWRFRVESELGTADDQDSTIDSDAAYLWRRPYLLPCQTFGDFFFQQDPLRLAPGKGSCLKEPPPLSRNRGGNQRYSALHSSSFISASDSIIEVQTSSDLTSGTMVTYFHPIYYTSPSTSSKSSQGDAPRIGHGWLRIRK